MLNALLDRRVAARTLAPTRMLVGVAALLLVVETWEILYRAADGRHLALSRASWLPDVTFGVTRGVALAMVLGAVLLIIGRGARMGAALVAVGAAAALALEQQAYSNHLLLLAVLSGLLALALPSRSAAADDVAYWPVWLLKVQVTTLYGFTALSKMNSDFLSGDVVQTFGRDLGIVDVAQLPAGVLVALSLGAVAGELFLAVGLWIERLRPAAFVCGLGVHAGILMLVGPTAPLIPFALLALSAYPLFIERTPRVVVWDDGCSSCRVWVAIFRRLDVLRLHSFVGASDEAAALAVGVTPEQSVRAMCLSSGGRVHEGYEAVRELLEACPATALAAPVMRVPPIRWVGHRVYERVALSRTCAVPASAAPPARARVAG